MYFSYWSHRGLCLFVSRLYRTEKKAQPGVGDDGGALIALIYGGWIHQLELDVGGNLPILCLQMVIDLA
jgi:hypothetical protein